MKWFALILISSQSLIAAWCCCDLEPANLSKLAEQLVSSITTAAPHMPKGPVDKPPSKLGQGCCSAEALKAGTQHSGIETADESIVGSGAPSETMHLSRHCGCPARLGSSTQALLPAILERGAIAPPSILPIASFLITLSDREIRGIAFHSLPTLPTHTGDPPDLATLGRFLI